MRSSATAGLTPQQLLDRRRAQNKLAQRRFREKARMVRSTGASSSASYLAAASALPTFPSHLDLSGSADHARDASPRIRSASSDSSCTSSSSASTSFSSSVSSPSSSEIETPTISSFKQAMPTEMTLVSNIYAPTALLTHNVKSDLSEADSLSLTHPTLMPTNYAIFGAPIMPPAPLLPPPSEPLTYSTLATSSSASNTDRNTGLKLFGMHADPFLMSQPLPSPSLLLGPAGQVSAFPFAAQFAAALPMFQESQSLPATSFESLLSVTPRLAVGSTVREDGASEETCPSPLSEATTHLDRAISRSTESYESRHLSRTAQPVGITARPFARVIESIASHFGLDSHGERLPQLLSHLHIYGKLDVTDETSKGLVFDAAINWDVMSSNMLPTTEQLLYPHRAFVDACLPWPAVRSRLLKHAVTHPICEEEFALDLLLSIVSDEEALASFKVYGDDVLDAEAWELSQRMLNKWWGLFDECVVKRTNWWRRQRGLKELAFPVVAHDASECERQGLGTGSLDEAHRLAALLL